jgi:type VI secretion system protein ImpC
MADPQSAPAGSPTAGQVQEKSLLDEMVEQGRFGSEPAARQRGKDLVKEFVGQFLEGNMTIARDAEMMINARIAQIDHLVSIQLNEILHQPAFQKLEATWRGVKYLMDQSETGVMLKIRILNVGKKELLKDLQRAPEFDQSALFKKVYEEEYGIFGGAPFGALVGDYEFGKHPEDLELLEGVSHVAAAAHAPFCTAASADMLNLPSWTDLNAPRDLAKVFDTTEYAKWKSFRLSQSAGTVAVWQRHQARGGLRLRRTRGWQRSFQVFVDECGLRARQPHDQLVLAIWHVRGNAGCGRRRAGNRPPGPQLLYG